MLSTYIPKKMENQKIFESEILIEAKLNEYQKLTNKLKRYWTRLMKESLKIAQQKGLETYVTDLKDPLQDNIVTLKKSDITILKIEDQIINDSELLELARHNYPSLYRRYHEGLQKHKSLEKELESYAA